MSRHIANSFQVPNVIIDEYMQKMSNSAFKCYLVIVRQTTGWNKPSDKISIRQFQKTTGIKKRDTIIGALSELEKSGLVIKHCKTGKITTYSLNFSGRVTRPENGDYTSPENGDQSRLSGSPENGDGGSPENGDYTSPENGDTTKHTMTKPTKTKHSTPPSGSYRAREIDGKITGRRVDGTNPKALGVSPRDLGVNPRELRKNPEALEKTKKKIQDKFKGAHPLPRDWLPSPHLADWAQGKRLTIDLKEHTERFCDYWWGCGKKKIDWDATWRNWMRRANEQSGDRSAIDQSNYRRKPTPVELVREANARQIRESEAERRTFEGEIVR